MKNKILSLGILIGIVSLSFAQKLPSVDDAFNYAKGNAKVYEKLKETYKIEDPKKVTIEKIARIGSGQWDPSKYNTFRSSQGKNLNWFWPDDRAYIVFKVTTPESAEGVIYELPLVVEYTRIQNQRLTNSWHLHRWYFDNPYSAKGGKLDALFMSLIEQSMGEFEYAFKPLFYTENPPCLDDLIEISEIRLVDGSEKREFASNRQEIKRVYEIVGTKIEFSNRDETEVSHLLKNQVNEVRVTFTRDVVNGKEKDWEVNSYYCIGFTEEGEEVQTNDLYLTLKRTGFNNIYKKEPTKTVIPYFTSAYQDMWEEGLKTAFIQLFEGDVKGSENIRNYTAGDSIAKGIIDYVNEFKNTLVVVDTKWIQINLKDNDEMNDENPESIANLEISYSRKSAAKDKALLKAYKNAGMSNDVLKQTGGRLNTNSDKSELRVALIEGEIKIISIPQLEEKIPF